MLATEEPIFLHEGGREGGAYSASRPYAVWRTRTASSVSSSSISTLTLISLVEIAWMLMPMSASARNLVLATPAWPYLLTPTTPTFATLPPDRMRLNPILSFPLSHTHYQV